MKPFKMGFWNGQNENAKGGTGKPGRPGIGFKLTSDGNFNLDNKKLTNVSDATNDSDAVTKKQTHHKSEDIDLQDNYNVKNSKPQSFQEMQTNYDNLISYEDAKKAFLSKKDTIAMEADLNMGNHQILNVKDPTVSDHGANKKYVDDEDAKHLPLSGGTMSGLINAGGQKITNLPSPTANADAATKKYVDYEVDTCLPLSGGTMAGNINASGNKITNLSSPTSTSEFRKMSFFI